MEVSGQLHAPAVPPAGKSPHYLFDRRLASLTTCHKLFPSLEANIFGEKQMLTNELKYRSTTSNIMRTSILKFKFENKIVSTHLL